MNRLVRTLVACAGPAAVATGVLVAALPAAGAEAPIPGLTAFGSSGAMVLPGALDTRLPTAASFALWPRLALDSGYNLNLGTNFAATDSGLNPLGDGGSFLSLANGGRYAGITYFTASNLRLRLGASLRSDRLDNFVFAPLMATGLPLTFERNQNESILAGASWDVSRWAALGFNAISSTRSGAPLNTLLPAPLDSRAATRALDVSARFDLGGNWVTNFDYGQAVTQINQIQGQPGRQDESYSVAIAKRGIFGDDAVGFSLSRPAPGMAGNFASLDTLGEVPPMVLAGSKSPLQTQETDLQLGYVTSFLTGRVALQTSAAYQMNYQGQTGANAVSIISHAKIKL